MKPITIVTSNNYKNFLMNNVKFSKLAFLENPKLDKKQFYQKINHKKSIKYNKIIENGYLFMKDEHAHFFLLLNPQTNNYDGTVFKIDSSGIIDFISNNPFNFITDEEEINIQIYGINTEQLIQDIQKHFGKQEFLINYDKIDDISDLIDCSY
jgi:hypothetical protein